MPGLRELREGEPEQPLPDSKGDEAEKHAPSPWSQVTWCLAQPRIAMTSSI